MIVFEDDFIVVVDKPSGLPTQSTRRGELGVYEQLQQRFAYVAVHHRLDQPVSGLLVFSRSKRANAGLARAISGRELRRIYVAMLYGAAKDGVWDKPLGGKPASTKVSVEASGMGLTAVRLQLETGRKHQIRQHAALAGTPLVGDRRYGEEAGHRWPRIALHSSELALRHPVSNEPLAFRSPLPPDLEPLWAEAMSAPSGD